LPATRRPVSSKFTTDAATRLARTQSVNPSRPAAARAVIVATVPIETGVPNSSANAAAVRLRDRNCPTIGGHIVRYNFSRHALIFPLRILTAVGSDADRCWEG
jgi:hypothetical protein